MLNNRLVTKQPFTIGIKEKRKTDGIQEKSREKLKVYLRCFTLAVSLYNTHLP